MQKDNAIKREELPSPILKGQTIPGTNIPDRGIPEEGLDSHSYDWYWNKIKDYVYGIDKNIQKPLPEKTMDPHIFVPPAYPKYPDHGPKQFPKGQPRKT